MLDNLTEAFPQWALPGLFLTYLAFFLYTAYRIIMDTQSAAKTLGYLLLLLVLPVLGIIVYFSFGVDTRHGESNKKLALEYKAVSEGFRRYLSDLSETEDHGTVQNLGHFTEMVQMVKALGMEKLTRNAFQLLSNGEEKFPELLRSLETATHHIHLEYYAWENDTRGNQIKEVLIRKAASGVAVRVLYDDFASHGIRKTIIRELVEGGVRAYPIIEIKFHRLANRLNHRDHRKVVTIDGQTGFIGGINLSDRYDNSIDTGLYWRDTHLKITGPGVMNLERHFVVNWNFSQPEPLGLAELVPKEARGAHLPAPNGSSQILAGGPIYSQPNIMLAYARLFTLARKRLYITNPYFIPNDTILDALKKAALSGVDVRLLLPEKSDSALVGAAARFYFHDLLRTGVKIYLYKKGFVHAKTAVADGFASIVGTANMDIRSFDLNFEILSIIYGDAIGSKLEEAFMRDLEESDQVTLDQWESQGKLMLLKYAIARLVSSFL